MLARVSFASSRSLANVVIFTALNFNKFFTFAGHLREDPSVEYST